MQSPFLKVALIDNVITYYLLTKQLRRNKETSSKQCLINLHLDLVPFLPLPNFFI